MGGWVGVWVCGWGWVCGCVGVWVYELVVTFVVQDRHPRAHAGTHSTCLPLGGNMYEYIKVHHPIPHKQVQRFIASIMQVRLRGRVRARARARGRGRVRVMAGKPLVD